jgi:PAS domain S-box-containing protein
VAELASARSVSPTVNARGRGYAEPVAQSSLSSFDRAFAEAFGAASQALVCVLSPDGKILLFNGACERATGYSRDEVEGRDAREFVIPPEEQQAFGEVLEGIRRSGQPSPQVGHWMTKDGDRRLIAWSNKPVANDDGEFAYLVTTGLDITDRAPNPEGVLEGDLVSKLAEVGRLAQEQRALRRVATLVASEATPERVFEAVSQECARVLESDASAVFRYEGNDTATVMGRFDRQEHDAFLVGSRIFCDDTSAVGRVLATGAPARIDDYSELTGDVPQLMRSLGYRSTVAAPIHVAGILWGAVVVVGRTMLPPDSEERLNGFAELVSLAVASAQAREDLRTSRARLVKTGDDQRRRLERNLHDGAQQRLVSLALTLKLALGKLDADPAAAKTLLEVGAKELDDALLELRELARGLHPLILSEQGLAPALRTLTDRIPLAIALELPEERFEPAVEATAYYIVMESLANAAKHARASKVDVSVRRDGDSVRVEIVDDGTGGAEPASGTGILGLRDRAEAIGGSLVVISPPGRGTTVSATLPL